MPIKQYGEIRTGTNYVRALLQQNHPQVLVLTYILGDKHSAPVPFDAIWRAAQTSPEPELEFMRRATYAARGPASHDGDITQLAELRRRAPDVVEAYRRGTMRFVITTKDPYAWMVSVAKFHQWVHDDVETLHDWDCDAVRTMCHRYNEHHAAWHDLVAANPSRARWVRFEDLLGGAEMVFRQLEEGLGLHRNSRFTDIPQRLEPTVWDHLPVLKTGAPFDPSQYTERRYLERLLPIHRQIIAATIDWPLFASFGYQPC